MINTYLFPALYSVCILVLVILWLQSGFDKISDFKGNYEWIKGQFSKSPLKGITKLLLIKLTVLEVSTGLCGIVAIGEIWIYGTLYASFFTCFLSMISLCALFFGQRLSKEYGGAASLMGYMIYTLAVLTFTVIMKEYFIDPNSNPC
jgi:hypothetical protein